MKQDNVLPEKDDLRPEYDLSKLKGAVCGKYLDRLRAGTNLALLAPDVRAAFPTDEAVNRAPAIIPGTKACLNGIAFPVPQCFTIPS